MRRRKREKERALSSDLRLSMIELNKMYVFL